MSIRKLFLFNGSVAMMTVLLCTSIALAGGPRDHSGGFFLRLSAGPGGASTSLDLGGSDLEFSGPSGDANFAIGAIVSPNLAIHGTLWGWLISDPDVKVGGVTGTANGDLSFNGLGAGLTYYFMPANIYLSGTLGMGWLTAEGGGFSETSDAGFAADLTLGKEWWVGNSWGIGVALGGSLHNVPVSGYTENWTGGSIGVRFTATLN